MPGGLKVLVHRVDERRQRGPDPGRVGEEGRRGQKEGGVKALLDSGLVGRGHEELCAPHAVAEEEHLLGAGGRGDVRDHGREVAVA